MQKTHGNKHQQRSNIGNVLTNLTECSNQHAQMREIHKHQH